MKKLTLEQYQERSSAAREAARASLKKPKLKQSSYKKKKAPDIQKARIIKTVRTMRVENRKEEEKKRYERYLQIKGTARTRAGEKQSLFSALFGRRKKNKPAKSTEDKDEQEIPPA